MPPAPGRGGRYMRIRKSILLAMMIVAISLCPSAADPDASATEARPRYSNFYGRLSIPSVGIDVALYRSNEQYVVDREDSAAIFKLSYRPKVWIIADHNTQSFASMTDIVVGDEGVISRADGDVVYLECVEVYDGHNTGYGLTDDHGVNAVGAYPYLTYTCIRYWRDIRICQWQTIETEAEE